MSFESLSPRNVTEEQYERDKLTRLRPDRLNLQEMYVFRMKTPPNVGAITFAEDYPSRITEFEELETKEYGIAFDLIPFEDNRSPFSIRSVFSESGLLVMDNTNPEEHLEGLPDTIEVGYFLGSILSNDFGPNLHTQAVV